MMFVILLMICWASTFASRSANIQVFGMVTSWALISVANCIFMKQFDAFQHFSTLINSYCSPCSFTRQSRVVDKEWTGKEIKGIKVWG